MNFDISDALCLAAFASVVLGVGLVAFVFLGLVAALGISLVVLAPTLWLEARAQGAKRALAEQAQARAREQARRW